MLRTFPYKGAFCIAFNFTIVAFTSIHAVPNYSTPQITPSYPTQSIPHQNDYPNSNDRPKPQDADRYEGKEEIAYRDRNEDKNLYERNLRLGDWDYKENWRYDKAAYYRGETQSQAYDEEHPGLRGIGYDAYPRASPNYANYNYSNRYNRNDPQEQVNYYYNNYPYRSYNAASYNPYNDSYPYSTSYPYNTTQTYDTGMRSYSNPGSNTYPQYYRR